MTEHQSDDQIDAMFYDWAASLHATTLQIAVPQYRRPAQRRRYLTVAAAIALIVLVSLGLMIAPQHRSTGNAATDRVAPTSPSARSAAAELVVGSGHVHDYILRDGDTVQGTGEVLVLPGRGPRFCAPRAFLNTGGVSSSDPEFGYCAAGVNLRGVDLDKLAGRNRQAGKVYGYAQLTGVYRHNTLTVTHQIAVKPTVESIYTNPPCAPPAGGWTTRYKSLDTIVDYQRSHPAQVVQYAYLLPSRHQRVPYVLTASAPGPIRAALTPTYGTDLCVARSRYTSRQLHRASAKMKSVLLNQQSPGSLTALIGAGGSSLSKNNQPAVPAEAAAVSAKIAGTVDALPRDIVQLQVWLAPTR